MQGHDKHGVWRGLSESLIYLNGSGDSEKYLKCSSSPRSSPAHRGANAARNENLKEQ